MTGCAGVGLAGLRVVELTGAGTSAAAYAGKLMAGFGAEVLRISLDKFQTPLDERGVWLNTGKRCTSFDLELPDQWAALAALIADVDVLLDGLGAGGLENHGFAAENLMAAHPRLIVVSVSPFGSLGPYRDFAVEEITLYAMTGLMHATGDGAKAPLNAGVAICAFTAGLNAYCAALMALLRRAKSGRGDHVELSIFESAMENCEIALAEFQVHGKVARRNNDEHAMVPWRAFPCLDGDATIIGGPIRNWPKGAKLFESEELLGPDFLTMADRIKNRARLRELMTPWLMRTDKRSVYTAGQAAGLAWSYIATLGDVVSSPQNKARAFFVEIEHPDIGTCRIPGAPFLGTQLNWTTTPPVSVDPLAVLWTKPKSYAAEATGEASEQALAGLKVIDFTHDWAGPHAARLLADFGAEVIKIEYPGRLDGMRGAYRDRIDGYPRFWQLHRGKRSVTLDLKRPEHLACCKALIADCDVLLENSRPGVMAGLGLDYETVKALNPSIVMVSMSAFGATGPESSYAGYGGTIEALTGLQSLTAYSPKGPFIRVREMDVLNGIMGDCAILTALAHRQATGEGQWIDLSESEACMWLFGEQFAAFTRSGVEPVALGNRHARYLQGCYPCAGEDRYVVLTIRDDAEWQRFAEAIRQPALASDPKFADAASRYAHHDAIDALITDWTRPQDSRAVMETLQAAGLACGMVMSARDLASDPQLGERGFFIEVDGHRLPGFPFRLANGGGQIRSRGPALGADNEAVLGPLGLPRECWPDLTPARLGTAFDEPGVAVIA